MSRLRFGKSHKEKVHKQNGLCSIQGATYEKQTLGLVGETIASFPDLPTTPPSFSPNSQLKPISVSHQMSKPDSGYSEFEDSEKDNSSETTHRENVLEIDNFHLAEQNRFLERELMSCKFNVESCKKVVHGKDVQISQISKERTQLNSRVKELEEIVDWFQANVPPSLWEVCPFSPSHGASSFSSIASEGESSYKADSQSRKSNEFKSKTGRRKSDSIRFMRGLFKFTHPKSDSRSKDCDEWINCEDEDLEVSTHTDAHCLSPTSFFHNSSSLDLPKFNSPKKDSKKLFSSLRFYKEKSNSATCLIDTPSSPSSIFKPRSSLDSISSRTELRNNISSRPTPIENISGSTSPQLSVTSDSVDDEEGEGEVDVDAELAALKSLDFGNDTDFEENDAPRLGSSTLITKSTSMLSCGVIEENIKASDQSISDKSSTEELKVNHCSNNSTNIELNSFNNSKPCHLSSPTSKENLLMKHLSISSEEIICSNSPKLPKLIINTTKTTSTAVKSLTDLTLLESPKINPDKLAQRPDRPLPSLPSIFSFNSSPNYSIPNFRKSTPSLPIKKIYPVRRRSSHRRSRSSPSIRSITATVNI